MKRLPILRHLRFVFLVAFLSTTLSFVTAQACTLFVLERDGSPVLAQNLDWEFDLGGSVYVNPPGVGKTVLPWRGDWPSGDPGVAQTGWVSRYASVTFSAYGCDFPSAGMNEAGLAVASANLDGSYGLPDERPGMSCAQWIQFQLDQYGSVKEVVRLVDEHRLDGEGWHFLVADASGDYAAIEHIDGETVIHRGADLPHPVLTNTTCAQAMAHIPLDRRFGGEQDIGAGDDSYGRFVRAAALLTEARKDTTEGGVEQALRILGSVRVDDTRRSIVFDIANRRVVWHTGVNPRLRMLSLEDLNVEEESPVRMVDVDAPLRETSEEGIMENGAFDVAVRLVPMTERANCATVLSALLAIHPRDRQLMELERRGFSFFDVADVIARHPLGGNAADD